MENKFPNFVVIESAILLDNRINNTDKIVYSIICALSNNSKQHCYATSDYICKLAKIKDRQLRNSLQHLVDNKYILISIKGNRRYIKPTINEFIKFRKVHNQIELFDYDWLNEN